MDKRKSLFKKNNDEVHWRSRYIDPSRRFTEFVRDLKFEQTLFGQGLQALDERFNLRTWAYIFVFCLVLSFVIFWDVDVFHEVNMGDVAPADIKSPISFQMVDEL
ncbi:MAG TPA: hypothetical protein PKC28_05025, partial [Bdellovibrionales bacterium]|nr:hypothetical protein [Bdellovibrionales bacterium]